MAEAQRHARSGRTAPTERQRARHEGPAPASPLGTAIAAAASALLNDPPRGFRSDCSGFVEATLAEVDIPTRGSTAIFWEKAEQLDAAHRRLRPAPGDLAFFDNTWDRDDDGRIDDDLSHVAVVLSVDAAGTITMAHAGTSKGRSLLRMNLLHPHERAADDGTPYNDPLRARRDGDPPGTVYLSGELWHGFATVRPADRLGWMAP